jgi:hypothetical protein
VATNDPGTFCGRIFDINISPPTYKCIRREMDMSLGVDEIYKRKVILTVPRAVPWSSHAQAKPCGRKHECGGTCLKMIPHSISPFLPIHATLSKTSYITSRDVNINLVAVVHCTTGGAEPPTSIRPRVHDSTPKVSLLRLVQGSIRRLVRDFATSADVPFSNESRPATLGSPNGQTLRMWK